MEISLTFSEIKREQSFHSSNLKSLTTSSFTAYCTKTMSPRPQIGEMIQSKTSLARFPLNTENLLPPLLCSAKIISFSPFFINTNSIPSTSPNHSTPIPPLIHHLHHPPRTLSPQTHPLSTHLLPQNLPFTPTRTPKTAPRLTQ